MHVLLAKFATMMPGVLNISCGPLLIAGVFCAGSRALCAHAAGCKGFAGRCVHTKIIKFDFQFHALLSFLLTMAAIRSIVSARSLSALRRAPAALSVPRRGYAEAASSEALKVSLVLPHAVSSQLVTGNFSSS